MRLYKTANSEQVTQFRASREATAAVGNCFGGVLDAAFAGRHTYVERLCGRQLVNHRHRTTSCVPWLVSYLTV